jgi:hypothetical protein
MSIEGLSAKSGRANVRRMNRFSATYLAAELPL